jgi:hypothetical protein
MDEILVKRLNLESKDLDCISKNDLLGYLQTKDTINRIENYLVKPFENGLREVRVSASIDSGAQDVFSSGGIYLGIENRDVPVLRESSEVVSKFEDVISDSLVQNEFGKRLDGVKRYFGTPTFDALNLYNLVEHFKSEKIGLERVLDVHTEFSNLGTVMDVYSPRLVFLDREFDFDVSNLSESDVGFYAAGKVCIENLNGRVINPFEELFLGESNDVGSSIFKFDDLGVVINSSVSSVCDYDSCLSFLQSNLLDISRMGASSSNGGSLFFNSKLINPRMYVSEKYLSGVVESERSKKVDILNRSLRVEYMPKFTHII